METKKDATALAEAIGKMPILGRLPSDARKELAIKGRQISCETRLMVLSAGAPHDYIFVVVEGQLDFCGRTSDGEEITLAVFGPGCASSWLAIYHETPAHRDLIGNPGSLLLAIPKQLIRSTLKQYPELFPDILAYEANRFRTLLDWQQMSLVSDRSRRIALMLAHLAEIKGDKSKQPLVKLSGERLAKTVHCSRQTLMTSLSKLQKKGLIEQVYGGVRLLDTEGLKSYANQD